MFGGKLETCSMRNGEYEGFTTISERNKISSIMHMKSM